MKTPVEVKEQVRNLHPDLATSLRAGLVAVPEDEICRVGERRFTRHDGALFAIAKYGAWEFEVFVDEEGALALAAGLACVKSRSVMDRKFASFELVSHGR